MQQLTLTNNMAVAAVVGVATIFLMSRNKFLLANVTEVTNRVRHMLTGGDRYDKIRASAEKNPWFTKDKGVAIVTGSNSGIGYETALGLARTGARVILAVRSVDKGKEAAAKITSATGNDKIDTMRLDMSSVSSVREFSTEFLKRKLPLHVLVHNAGASEAEVSINSDGIENTMALNFVNVVLLTSLLIPVLRESSPSRVVIVGSSAHYNGDKDIGISLAKSDKSISGWALYGSSKMNVIAYSNYMARMLSAAERNNGISICSLDPGFVATSFYTSHPVPFPISLFGKVAGLYAKSPAVGAHSSLFASLSPVPAAMGAYLADTYESTPLPLTKDERFQDQLMESTMKALHEAAPWWGGMNI